MEWAFYVNCSVRVAGIDNHRDAISWCIREGNSSKHADLIDDWAQQLPHDNMGGSMFGSGVPVAVKEKDNNHQGLGLAHLMKLVNTYRGQLLLASGDVCLVADGEDVCYEDLETAWPGVAISCRFKISDLAVEHDNEHDIDQDLADIIRALGGD